MDAIVHPGDYIKIKNEESAKVRQPEESTAELTKLGWVIISPVYKYSATNLVFNVLENLMDNETDYYKFKNQLECTKES